MAEVEVIEHLTRASVLQEEGGGGGGEWKGKVVKGKENKKKKSMENRF
jgi:hypothetical protein